MWLYRILTLILRAHSAAYSFSIIWGGGGGLVDLLMNRIQSIILGWTSCLMLSIFPFFHFQTEWFKSTRREHYRDITLLHPSRIFRLAKFYLIIPYQQFTCMLWTCHICTCTCSHIWICMLEVCFQKLNKLNSKNPNYSKFIISCTAEINFSIFTFYIG